MLFDNLIFIDNLCDFDQREIKIFYSINKKIYEYIYELYDYDPSCYNIFEEKHIILILNIVRGIVNNYHYYNISSENLNYHSSFKILFWMTYTHQWNNIFEIDEIYIAVIYSFYSHVLLDSYGSSPSLEEICELFFIKKDDESYIKIQSIFYGIAISDHPLFQEIRRRIILPHLCDNMLFA